MGDYEAVLKSGGMFNTAYHIKRRDGVIGKDYLIRLGPVDYTYLLPYEENLMEAEAWAYERLAEVGIPTSKVVYLDTTKSLHDRDIMIVEYIDSVDLYHANLNESDLYEAQFTVGRYCRMMNAIKSESFGRVSNILRGRGFARWSGYIKSEISELVETVDKNAGGYYTERELAEILSLADRYADILDEITVPCFNHCDIWGANILMRREGCPEIAAVIDPDRACMGDPDFELASGWMQNDAFYDGYGRRMSDDPHTKIRTDIYKLIYLMINGYFMRVQYDDTPASEQDRASVIALLRGLTEDPSV